MWIFVELSEIEEFLLPSIYFIEEGSGAEGLPFMDIFKCANVQT